MCSLRELNPLSHMYFRRGGTAPTARPGSYKESLERPQFYRLQGGTLIRDESQACLGSTFSAPPCTSTSSLVVGDCRSRFLVVCAVRTRCLRGRAGQVFSSPPGFEPQRECSERVVLPTELAGHGDVQPSPLRFLKNRVTDPARFGFFPRFSPILLADTKIMADSATWR